MFQFYPEGTIISTGLSKWASAGGWRVGKIVSYRKAKKLALIVITLADRKILQMHG